MNSMAVQSCRIGLVSLLALRTTLYRTQKLLKLPNRSGSPTLRLLGDHQALLPRGRESAHMNIIDQPN